MFVQALGKCFHSSSPVLNISRSAHSNCSFQGGSRVSMTVEMLRKSMCFVIIQVGSHIGVFAGGGGGGGIHRAYLHIFILSQNPISHRSVRCFSQTNLKFVSALYREKKSWWHLWDVYSQTSWFVLCCFRAACVLSDKAERHALPLTEETTPKLQRLLRSQKSAAPLKANHRTGLKSHHGVKREEEWVTPVIT